MEQEQNDNKLQISLAIGGQVLRPTINRDDEFFYREAQRKLSDRINYLANAYPKVEYQNILTIVALEAAVDRERLLGKQSENGAVSANKINEWNDLLERVFSEN